MTLVAHCGTKRIDEAQVLAVPEPEFTPTWHPISHAKVIGALGNACEDHGLRVLNREYSLNEKGTRMFGAWDLEIGDNKIGYSLGIRNAIDKSMLLGLCGGSRVFVCDNLCFSGDYITMRKHTSGLTLESLTVLAIHAIAGAIKHASTMIEWQKQLHDKYVPKDDFKVITFDLMENGVFAPSQFNEYTRGVDAEAKDVGNRFRSLHNVHGGVTRMLRGQSLFNVADRSKKLNGVIDRYLVENPIIN